MPGIKRSHTCTRQFSVISMKQQGIVRITISGDIHTDKMNCSPSQTIPYIKLLCRSYHNDGICNYGAKCKFIHELSEKRVLTPGEASQQSVILVLPSNTTLKKFMQIQKSENTEQTKQLSSQNKSVNLPSESQHFF